MDEILNDPILGNVIMLALAGLLSLGLREFLRARLRRIDAVLEPVVEKAVPRRIHVVVQASLSWDDPARVAQVAERLQQIGFTDVCLFTVEEWPNVKCRVLMKQEDCVYALVFDRPPIGVSLSFTT